MDNRIRNIIAQFALEGTPTDVRPLGNGLINDTYKVETAEAGQPGYVLQRINNAVFTDVDLLQDNIEKVTTHIRKKLLDKGQTDIDRHVLRFMPEKTTGKTYYQADDGTYWRVMVFIDHAVTYEQVNADTSREAGKAFGEFEGMLTDLPYSLGETIPDFHNMELRARQFDEALHNDVKGRSQEVEDIIATLQRDMTEMCQAERLHREGKLPKRICHCDTKVNNMMYDEAGQPLCVIDLDTVMPSYVFSDYGDFLRTAANAMAEDDPHIDQVSFRMDIFEAFTQGYLEGTANFLTPIERDHLPFAAALFPFMQCVRFLTDYLNGDTYYRIRYPEHNLVRTRNQLALYLDVRQKEQQMKEWIEKA